MRVLIALDESRHSDLALASVKVRTWPRETKFLLCSVIEDVMASSVHLTRDSTLGLQRLRVETESFTLRVLQGKAAELLRACPDADVSLRMECGKVSDRIVAAALRWDADLIIMGSHGRRGIQRYALGSVAESVVERAPCSVEVIKSPKSVGRGLLEQRRILVCYDGSRNADAAIRWIAESDWSFDQEFVLIATLAPLEDVIHPRLTQKKAVKHVKSILLEEAQNMLESRCAFLRSRLETVQVEAVVAEGYAAETIIEFADKWGADLLVLGAHNDDAADAGPLGSVARRVVAGAKCFVKLVRDKVGFTYDDSPGIIPLADLSSVQ